MKNYIHAGAEIRTDGWAEYKGRQADFPNLKQEKSETKRKNFPPLHRTVMMFKAWLRGGIQYSFQHLQAYIDEYAYRFNRQQMKEGILKP